MKLVRSKEQTPPWMEVNREQITAASHNKLMETNIPVWISLVWEISQVYYSDLAEPPDGVDSLGNM